MTDKQKRRITLMRQQHIGYSAIARELRLSLSTVKTFCRRNGLQGADLETDTQAEKKLEESPAIDLINPENRGNSRPAQVPGRLGNTRVSGNQPVCELTVAYADADDETAVTDVLDMLMKADYGEVKEWEI